MAAISARRREQLLAVIYQTPLPLISVVLSYECPINGISPYEERGDSGALNGKSNLNRLIKDISHRLSHRRVSPIGHLIGLFLIGVHLL
jgi:hypothetical protein